MNLLKILKEFFNKPDEMDLIEEIYRQKLEDMKAHPEKYQHILKKNSGNSNIPPVSVF